MPHLSYTKKYLITSSVTSFVVGVSFFAIFTVTRADFNNDVKCFTEATSEELVVEEEAIKKYEGPGKTRSSGRHRRSARSS